MGSLSGFLFGPQWAPIGDPGNSYAIHTWALREFQLGPRGVPTCTPREFHRKSQSKSNGSRLGISGNLTDFPPNPKSQDFGRLFYRSAQPSSPARPGAWALAGARLTPIKSRDFGPNPPLSRAPPKLSLFFGRGVPTGTPIGAPRGLRVGGGGYSPGIPLESPPKGPPTGSRGGKNARASSATPVGLPGWTLVKIKTGIASESARIPIGDRVRGPTAIVVGPQGESRGHLIGCNRGPNGSPNAAALGPVRALSALWGPI